MKCINLSQSLLNFLRSRGYQYLYSNRSMEAGKTVVTYFPSFGRSAKEWWNRKLENVVNLDDETRLRHAWTADEARVKLSFTEARKFREFLKSVMDEPEDEFRRCVLRVVR